MTRRRGAPPDAPAPCRGTSFAAGLLFRSYEAEAGGWAVQPCPLADSFWQQRSCFPALASQGVALHGEPAAGRVWLCLKGPRGPACPRVHASKPCCHSLLFALLPCNLVLQRAAPPSSTTGSATCWRPSSMCRPTGAPLPIGASPGGVSGGLVRGIGCMPRPGAHPASPAPCRRSPRPAAALCLKRSSPQLPVTP